MLQDTELRLITTLALLVRVTDIIDSGLHIVHLLLLESILVIHHLDPLLDVRELLHVLLLHVTRLMTHKVFQLAYFALPDIGVVRNGLLLHDHNILGILEFFLKVKHPDEISDHRDLLLNRSLNLHFLDAIEGVSHDCDEKVHKEELSDESGK